MIKSDKKLAELRRVLESGKHTDIEEGILKLRDTEPFIGALLLLASFYGKTTDDNIHLAISGFFNDLKEKAATGEVIEALVSAGDPATTAMLAASCWQSGLDYSAYATSLAEVFIRGDYLTSLECFTVLDTCASMIPDTERERIIVMLEKEVKNQEKSRQQLTTELITLLKQ